MTRIFQAFTLSEKVLERNPDMEKNLSAENWARVQRGMKQRGYDVLISKNLRNDVPASVIIAQEENRHIDYLRCDFGELATRVGIPFGSGEFFVRLEQQENTLDEESLIYTAHFAIENSHLLRNIGSIKDGDPAIKIIEQMGKGDFNLLQEHAKKQRISLALSLTNINGAPVDFLASSEKQEIGEEMSPIIIEAKLPYISAGSYHRI